MTKHQITAFIYDKRGRLLSIGRNSYVKTHPLMAQAAKKVGQEARIYLHAEVAALVKLKDWTRAYKLVVARFNKAGEAASSKPCKCCQHIINMSGIKYVEHT